MRPFFLYLFLTPLLSFSQVTDNFSDGDFSADPPWTGDVLNYTVNVSKQLQTTNTIAASSYLSTHNTLGSLNDMEWRFYIKQGFSPSASNYGRVYLVSDQENLEGNLNGYYLQFGEAGTNDAITLFKQSDSMSAPTSIARGTNALIANSFTLTVKVTRDDNGLWNVYTDPAGGNNFVSEANGTDNSFNSSSYFGFVSVYTASNANKFYFDDFYIGSIIVDHTPPSIASVNVIANNQLDIDFDEPVELSSAQTPINYNVNNDIGNPLSATRDISDWSLMHLVFSSAFPDAQQNTLTINNVQDIAGNTITTISSDFIYHAPVFASYGDVIINEIFADPSPQIGLPAAEFVELYNKSTKTLNLHNWKFSDASSTATLGTYTLFPGDHLILCNANDMALFSAFGNTLGLSNFPSLNNSADRLYLKDNNNTFIDSLIYNDSWYKDEDKKNGGWSLELINPTLDNTCPVASNWRASNDTAGGTPGIQNSVYSAAADTTGPLFISAEVIDSMHIRVCLSEAVDSILLKNPGNYMINESTGFLVAVPETTLTCVELTLSDQLLSGKTYTISLSNLHDCADNPVAPAKKMFTYYIAKSLDVVINEIMADPDPSVGLPGHEYIELYNRTHFDINLKDWIWTVGQSSKILPDILLPAASFLVLMPATALPDYADTICIAGLTSFPGLANTSQTISLKNASGITISTVSYTDSWYKDANKTEGGWSLELINPQINNACPVSNNWKASISNSGGTPGMQNSIHSVEEDTSKPLFVSATAADTNTLRIRFDEAIDSTLLSNKTNYFINGMSDIASVVIDPSFTSADLKLRENLSSEGSYTLSLVNLADCSGNAVSPSSKTFSFYIPKQFDVVINEIMADPDPIIGLPDHEYIELYNTSPFEINLHAWTLTVGEVSKTLPDVSVLPDSFLVLTSAFAINEFGNSIAITGLAGFPSLTNSGQIIKLKNPKGGTISTVAYTDKWYENIDKQEGGWSLEQIDAENPCTGTGNWRASLDLSGGTPGRKNSVAAKNPDLSPPRLIRVSVIDSATIQLYFDEPLDSTTLLNTSRYTIDNEIGNPFSISPGEPDYTSAILKLNHQLEKGIYYTIALNHSITDCKGNPLNSAPVLFAIPEKIHSSDLVINEILFAPIEGGVDFVELYNVSDKVIDLKNISLSSYDTILQTLTSVYPVSNEGYLLFPHEYIVLTTEPAKVKDQYFTSNPNGFLQMETLPALNVSDGIVAISTDTLIDQFTYTEDMHFALLNDNRGVSLERIDFKRPGQDKTNWHSAAESVGFATPAYRNSQYLSTPHGNNIKIAPEIFSPDNDGFNDVVNIIYGFDSPGFVANIIIYDSKGRKIRSLVKNELLPVDGVFSWDGINENNEKAPIGIYIVYFEIFNLQGEVRHFKNTCVLASKL